MSGAGSDASHPAMNEPARVLLALDAAAQDPFALEVFVELARAFDSELAALIVQDIDLLKLARLPFALEYGALTASARPLDEQRLGFGLRERVARLERQLIASLKQSHQRFSLSVTEGKMVPRAMAASTNGDFVLFGTPQPLLHQPALGLSPAHRRGIVLLVEEAPPPSRALEVAAQLQRRLNTSLSILVAGLDDEAFARLRTEISAYLSPGPRPARFRRVACAQPVALARAAAAERAELLVLPRALSVSCEADLGALLSVVRCSLLWVR